MFTQSLGLSPSSKCILIDKTKLPITRNNEVERTLRPSLKPYTNLSPRSKTPPPRRSNSPHPRPKTPQRGRHNSSRPSNPMWNYPPWGMFPPYMYPNQMQSMYDNYNFRSRKQWGPSG